MVEFWEMTHLWMVYLLKMVKFHFLYQQKCWDKHGKPIHGSGESPAISCSISLSRQLAKLDDHTTHGQKNWVVSDGKN